MSLRLEDVPTAELTGAVRRSCGRERMTVADWDITAITYDATNPSSQGVYRVSGNGIDDGKRVSWSLVLKVVSSPDKMAPQPGYWPRVFLPEAGLDPPPMYWEREPLAYQSGLLNDLHVGLAAPKCFGVIRRTSSVYCLWLEDLADAPGERWTLRRYVDAARCIGRFNGAYLAGRALPAHPWARHGWMRAWLDEVSRQGGMERILAAAQKEPVMCRVIPSSMMDAMKRLWRERAAFLDTIDRLPRTLCHRDLVPANLLAGATADGQERLVAVDWAFVGIGPVGEDLPPLVLVPASSGTDGVGAAQRDEQVFEAYIEGLRDAGWDGEERLARLGYAGSAALRYGCLTATVILMHALDPVLREAMAGRRGQSIGVLLEREVETFSYVLGLANEARTLLPATLRRQ